MRDQLQSLQMTSSVVPSWIVLGLVAAVWFGLAGCKPITWMDGPERELSQSSISKAGPNLGTLRHRDRQYDLRRVIAEGATGSNDEFIREFNRNYPVADLGRAPFDARTKMDAVDVEDSISTVDILGDR